MYIKNHIAKLQKMKDYLDDAIHHTLPKDAYLQVTQNCNADCMMCLFGKTKKEYVPFETIQEIIHVLKEKEMRRVTLRGGEPYLHPNIIDIMKEVKSGGMKLQFITNGSLITGKKLEATHQYVDNIVFSIDSPYSDIHDQIRGKSGIFTSAIKNLKELQQLATKDHIGPSIELDVTILNKNIDHIEEMVGFGKELGDIFVDFDPAQLYGPGNNSDEHMVDISKEQVTTKIDALIALADEGANITSPAKLQLIKQYLLKKPIHESCYSVFKDLLIAPHGDVYFCRGQNKVIGNILDKDFEDKRKAAIAQNIGVITGETPECKGCGFSHSRLPDPGYKGIIEGINQVRKLSFVD